jgi:predicted DNA-binding mobile mystery protein A
MSDAIRHLDRDFSGLWSLTRRPHPPKGWLRAIRDALGMTTKQFGHRLGVSRPRIIKLEKSEVDGTITLHTLQRTADGLGCRLVRALVPEKPLAQTMHERAAVNC